MAKVIIEFEDKFNGGVKVVCNPTFEEIMKKQESGEIMSSAEAYAIFALNQVRSEAKKVDPTRILIPKVKL